MRRFVGGKQRVRREWIRVLTTADDPQRVVFVAEHDGAIIGVTQYERSGEHTAEAGLVVRDDWRNTAVRHRGRSRHVRRLKSKVD